MLATDVRLFRQKKRSKDQMVKDEERTMLELREEIRKAAREIKKVGRSIRR